MNFNNFRRSTFEKLREPTGSITPHRVYEDLQPSILYGLDIDQVTKMLDIIHCGIELDNTSISKSLFYWFSFDSAFPFWDPIIGSLSRILGRELPHRFEVLLHDRREGDDYRVLHVSAEDEAAARRWAARAVGETSCDELIEEIRDLGAEIDHPPGVLWDSGSSRKRYPEPPPL